ncbi:demethylmenaquinone methyltransferase [Oceanobacillus jeddahense]|uniref:Demethylmenaquinone methyltransferase n=1 Tax=Oceanobacillus jeddahense TaxID=1462527 RepID=A0ABY5JMC1_9BACI|nr:demethylmenaquinone methyltransferase [Oceanobacillus jeddahense]UUI00964.1 demethylmenaquinone methyltransferase [Oceanobacillus jeddahense]
MGYSSKEERVHHVFEKIYENYDSMNSVISFKQHTLWRRDVMKRMHVSEGDSALDVCCGTGDWSISLANAVGNDGRVVGLDFSENMLSIAKEKGKQEQGTKIEWIHGNAMELPFDDNQFDYVTIGFGLRNVPDYMTVLKEMYRVVKPGGMVVCLETSQPTLIGYRQLYYFYFRFIMPLFGKIFAKSYQEYSWLQESAKDFPGKDQLKQMFFDAGFKHVDVKTYAGGGAAMHMGHKS